MAVGLVACHAVIVGPSAQAVALHVRPIPGDGSFVMNIGDSLAFEALPVASDSTVVGPAVIASWRSNDTTIVSVTDQGVLQSHCAGSTTVEATATVAGHSLFGTRQVVVGSTGPRCVP
jgi:hypothetical protein